MDKLAPRRPSSPRSGRATRTTAKGPGLPSNASKAVLSPAHNGRSREPAQTGSDCSALRAAQNRQHLHPAEPADQPRAAAAAWGALSRPQHLQKALLRVVASPAMGPLGSQDTPKPEIPNPSHLLELAGNHPERIHTILFSFEAIFGTLRSGLATNDAGKRTKQRTQDRLVSLRQVAHQTVDDRPGRQPRTAIDRMDRVVCQQIQRPSSAPATPNCSRKGATRPKPASLSCSDKPLISPYTDPKQLEQTLTKLGSKRDLKVVSINYDQASDPHEPSTFLWNVLKQSLPQQADLIRQQLEANTDNENLNKTTNPGLNERGLELAIQARPLFNAANGSCFANSSKKISPKDANPWLNRITSSG